MRFLNFAIPNPLEKQQVQNYPLQKQWFASGIFQRLRTHHGFRRVFRRHLGQPFGGLVWLRPAAARAAKCKMQLALHLLPRALAAAGCGESIIYALAAALTNSTYALPAIKVSSNISANVSSNHSKALSAHLALHVCAQVRAHFAFFYESQKPQHTYAQQLRFHLAQHMSAQTHSSHCLFDKHAPSSTNYKSRRTTTPASSSSSTNYKSRRTTTHASASSSTNYKSRRKNMLQVVRITSPNDKNAAPPVDTDLRPHRWIHSLLCSYCVLVS